MGSKLLPPWELRLGSVLKENIRIHLHWNFKPHSRHQKKKKRLEKPLASSATEAKHYLL